MSFDRYKNDSFGRSLGDRELDFGLLDNRKLDFGSLTEKEWCVLETTPEHPEKFDRSFPAANGGRWYLRTCNIQVMIWTDQDKQPGYAISLPGRHPKKAPYEFTESELMNLRFHLMELMENPNYLIKDFSTKPDFSKVDLSGVDFSKIREILSRKPDGEDPKK
ncbi:MAG: hypothetical protein WC708_00025 [Lentisphaeria bacterium]|jgi:hypothetical protein